MLHRCFGVTLATSCTIKLATRAAQGGSGSPEGQAWLL